MDEKSPNHRLKTTGDAPPSQGRAFPVKVDYFRMARHSGPIHFLTAVSLNLGALVLLDAGLYSAASRRYPSGGGIGAIIGPCIERNRRAWGSLTNSVDDDFE